MSPSLPSLSLSLSFELGRERVDCSLFACMSLSTEQGGGPSTTCQLSTSTPDDFNEVHMNAKEDMFVLPPTSSRQVLVL